MLETIYRHATEAARVDITLEVGDPADITSVGMYCTTDPDASPELTDFTAATFVNGVDNPSDPLAEPDVLTVLAYIGPGGDIDGLAPGEYQTFVLLETSGTPAMIRPSGGLIVV